MNTPNIDRIIDIAGEAGRAILQVYRTDFDIEHKEDKSPLTEADMRSHEIITSHLAEFDLPVLSEESKGIVYEERRHWDRFWLVDPLDGTKEFVKRNGEFTVNIALIDNGTPILGVVYAPVPEITYYASGGEAFRRDSRSTRKLPCESPDTYRIVASRSHMSPETEQFVKNRRAHHPDLELVSRGSSLKLCMVAEGTAACYPRLAPTMEWDTAAAHAVVLGAGKKVVQYDSVAPLHYNKENLLNPFFVVE